MHGGGDVVTASPDNKVSRHRLIGLGLADTDSHMSERSQRLEAQTLFEDFSRLAGGYGGGHDLTVLEAEKSVQYRPLKQRLCSTASGCRLHLCGDIASVLKSHQSSRVSALTIHAVHLVKISQASEVLPILP
jgi:hypothetical protein